MPALARWNLVAALRPTVASDATAVYGRLVVAWLVLRTLLWTATAVVTHPNPPLDLIEQVAWGNTWQLGYPQHPPLTVWLAALVSRLTPGDVRLVYLLSYLSATACVWAAWRVGSLYLPARTAAVSALALDGFRYLTADADEWNNNVSLSTASALTVWFGLSAVRTGSAWRWAAAGLFAGAAVLCKYTAGFLLAPLVGHLLLAPAGRRLLRTPGPYLGALVAVAVTLPHLLWLVENDYLPLRYAAGRAAGAGGWAGHVVTPISFLATQAAFLLPVLFVLAPLLGRSVTPAEQQSPDRWLLRVVAWGPIGLFVVYGAVTGSRLRDNWGAPFWTFLGVWAVAEFGRRDDPAAVRRALIRWAIVAAAVWAVFVVKQEVGPRLSPNPSRVHFPGRAVADEINRRYADRYGRLPPIVAGEAWTAGNVLVHSPHRPVLYSSWWVWCLKFEPPHCPWTGDDDLNARGGVIVWDITVGFYGDTVPAEIRARFPRLTDEPPVVLPYQIAGPAPARVGVAFVPPAK